MRPTRMCMAWLVATAMLAAVPISRAQNAEAESGPQRATEVPPEGGFWPTPKMVERIIDHMVDDGIGLYGFDPIQRQRTGELLKERVPRWLAENRAEVMSLTNSYLEALLDKEPPDPETVAQWAQRLLPVMGSFEQEIVGITDGMREFLSDEQIVVLEGELAAVQTGLGFVTNKVRHWADGGFDPRTDWPTGEDHDRQRRDEEDEVEEAVERAKANAMAEAEGKPLPYPDEPEVEPAHAPPPAPPSASPAAPAIAAAPADEWAKYTDEFIRKYELNADQQSKARSHLTQAQKARDTYLKRPKTQRELTEVDQLIRDLKPLQTDDSRTKLAAAEERRAKVYEPVENEFNRFKKKLGEIPTREQRRKVLEAEKAAAAASQPSDTDTAPSEKP